MRPGPSTGGRRYWKGDAPDRARTHDHRARPYVERVFPAYLSMISRAQPHVTMRVGWCVTAYGLAGCDGAVGRFAGARRLIALVTFDLRCCTFGVSRAKEGCSRVVAWRLLTRYKRFHNSLIYWHSSITKEHSGIIAPHWPGSLSDAVSADPVTRTAAADEKASNHNDTNDDTTLSCSIGSGATTTQG
eukprot:406914-Rhodomonas_salina.6